MGSRSRSMVTVQIRRQCPQSTRSTETTRRRQNLQLQLRMQMPRRTMPKVGRRRHGVESSCLSRRCWKPILGIVSLHLASLNVSALTRLSVHAWDYRRYVLSSLPATFRPAKTPETEIKYTTKKIESNFSNFSAWHQRTKELGKVWDSLRKCANGEVGDAEAEIQKMREKGDSIGFLIGSAGLTFPYPLNRVRTGDSSVVDRSSGSVWMAVPSVAGGRR